MDTAVKENDKEYYLEYIKMLLKPGETIENYNSIHEEYLNAYNTRKAIIDNLYSEIKSIKKLKI